MEKELTQELVRELLDYNPDEGTFYWRKRSIKWFKSERSWKIWNPQFAGKKAGTLARRKYGYECITICLFNKNYQAHRLAWLYMLGDPLPIEIDHDNRDGTDNRWVNLMPSSSYSNTRNKSKYRNNTSGHTGVTFDRKRGKWRARCKLSGRYRHLGWHSSIDGAIKAVKDFREANGFSSGHGESLARYVDR